MSRGGPFFSIVIPTYNRAEELRIALHTTFKQTYKNFELIVANNNSMDNTDEVMKGFSDPRLVYVKNKKNLGWIPSLSKAIKKANGEYVILQGDDDFMMFDDVLEKIYAKISETKCNFLRVKYLNMSPDKKNVFDFNINKNKNLSIKNNESGKKIVEFIENIDPFFITGIIFKNNLPSNVNLFQSEFVPWFKVIYHSIRIGGGEYLSDYLFAASWSQNFAHPRYLINNGKFQFENYFNQIAKVLEKEDYAMFLIRRLDRVIKELPANKYYTSNKNIINFSKRILELSPGYKFSLSFWLWFLISFLTPKKILGLYRTYFISNLIKECGIKQEKKYLGRINKILKLKQTNL